MKKNNLLYIVFTSILLISIVTGCNKLNETAYSAPTPDNFFGSQADVAAALVGMYRPLQACCNSYEQAGTFILNSASDEGTSSNPSFGQIYDNLTYTPAAPDIAGEWSACYQSISGANFVLDNEAKVTALDASSNQSYTKAVLAEARFVRAVNYFQLVQMFGAVPLRVTQAKTQGDVDIPRSPTDSVYAQIITDFQDAEANLPATCPAGKPTKWAASAFLAKVYLTKGDYPNALTEATNVVNNGPYSLQPKFEQVFDVNNKNNSEVIFAIQYIRKDQFGSRIGYLVMGADDNFNGGSSGGWELTNMEKGQYKIYNPSDDRINTTFTNPAPNQVIYHAGKWRDTLGVSVDGQGNDFIVYRYADLKLILAETENEVNGPTPIAYANINAIRNRALLPDLTPGLTKDQFRDSVLFERNLELNFEEVRWFDLKRTGKLKSTLVADGKIWDDRFYLFPIPQSEIDASTQLKQNPGY